MSSAERLAGIQADLLQPDVSPQVARKHLIYLTVMWGDVKAAAVESDIAYRRARPKFREAHKSAADATIYAEASDEYGVMRRAIAQSEYYEELIRTCKAAMKSIDEEMRMQR